MKIHISGNTYPFELIEGFLPSLSEDVITKIIVFTRNCTGKIGAARIMLIKFLCAAAYVDPVRTPDLLIWIIHFA